MGGSREEPPIHFEPASTESIFLIATPTFAFPGERLHPFISGGLGLTFLVPDGPGLDSETNFSVSLVFGAKIPFSKRVGLRLDLFLFPHRVVFPIMKNGGRKNLRKERKAALRRKEGEVERGIGNNGYSP